MLRTGLISDVRGGSEGLRAQGEQEIWKLRSQGDGRITDLPFQASKNKEWLRVTFFTKMSSHGAGWGNTNKVGWGMIR